MTILWRIQFTLAVSWILRDYWLKFGKLYLGLGWDISRTMKQNKKPYQAALDEITRWYTE